MSNLRQAAQQALEALEEATTYTSSPSWSPSMTNECNAAITALRAALAATVAEPVAIHQWRKRLCAEWYEGHPDHSDGGGPYETRTLYAAPPQRERWRALVAALLPMAEESLTRPELDPVCLDARGMLAASAPKEQP